MAAAGSTRAQIYRAGSRQELSPGLGTSATLPPELQPAPGAAEPRGGTRGEPGKQGTSSQGWQFALWGQVEQAGFRFLRARVCCAFVVTMTALLGQSTVLGQLLLFLIAARKRKPGRRP